MKPKYGFLIDYEFCTGCHSCEISCKQEHNRLAGESGIKVIEIDPRQTGGKSYYFPFITDKCNLCGKRIAKGLKPACIHNCWTGVMIFGLVKELAVDLDTKPRRVLWVPR